jgi:hypothetical protein
VEATLPLKPVVRAPAVRSLIVNCAVTVALGVKITIGAKL